MWQKQTLNRIILGSEFTFNQVLPPVKIWNKYSIIFRIKPDSFLEKCCSKFNHRNDPRKFQQSISNEAIIGIILQKISKEKNFSKYDQQADVVTSLNLIKSRADSTNTSHTNFIVSIRAIYFIGIKINARKRSPTPIASQVIDPYTYPTTPVLGAGDEVLPYEVIKKEGNNKHNNSFWAVT